MIPPNRLASRQLFWRKVANYGGRNCGVHLERKMSARFGGRAIRAPALLDPIGRDVCSSAFCFLFAAAAYPRELVAGRFSTIHLPLLLWFSAECQNRDCDHQDPCCRPFPHSGSWGKISLKKGKCARWAHIPLPRGF